MEKVKLAITATHAREIMSIAIPASAPATVYKFRLRFLADMPIVNYSQLKQGAFSSPAVSKPTASLWGGLQHPQSTVTSALNNRFRCPQCNYNLKQLKLLKELSSPH
jgi:hypothetical protein